MISKEQLATVSEVFVTASVVSIGWALGGTVGAAIVAGVGINLGSDIIQKGSAFLKEKWLSREYGVLNHDIQRALVRALIKALDSLETRYFELPETDVQPNEKKRAIRGLFKELREISPSVFAASVERITTDQEVNNYLYGDPQTARQELWERIEGTKLIYSYYGDFFKTYLRDNINDELVRWFGEELKNDNRESNKAWRAFQRMLLEGIQADLKMIQADQELIREDLLTLEEIEHRLDAIKEVIDRRTDYEPFKNGLEDAIEKINADLATIAQTTSRTEGKVDVVVATTERVEAKIDTVVATLDQPPHVEIPKLPDDVQALFDEGLSLRIEGNFKEARTAFDQGQRLAEKHGHKLAIAKAKYYQAAILNEWDHQPTQARILLEQCLEDFRSEKSEIDVATALFNLGTLELPQGNLDEAKAYFSQSLELSRKLKKKILTASVLHQLGWLEHQRGNSKQGLLPTEEALSLFLSVYQDHDPKSEKDSKHGVALCYHHLGLIHHHLGDSDKAESNLMRALEWNRKAGSKPEIAKVIWLLANMKFTDARYKEGVELLREAVSIYAELEDFLWLSRCLDLQGRLHYTLGQKRKAFEFFEFALIAAAKSGDYREQVSYLVKLGRLLVTEDEADRAKECFEEARNIALREELWDSYVGAVEQLARMAHREKNVDERDRLLRDGIQKLTTLLHKVQAEPHRAYIIGRIGFLYEMIGDLQQSLTYYLRSKNEFEELSDVGGVAKNLASIARIKGFMGDKHEEFNTYREAKQLLVGTPYHDMIAHTAILLGEIQMRLGNLDEAKALLEEAEFLGRKYNLPNQNYQQTLARQLNQLIGMRKPPEKSFSELVRELFELIDWFPEAKDSILRFWLGARMEMLHSNFRSTIGVKLMLCQDDVDTFLKTAQVLHTYADLCLQAVGSEYPGTGIDLIPFPRDKDLFFDCGIPFGKTLEDGSIAISFKSGGIESRYTLTSDTARSDTTGNEGVIIMGWVMGLPEQAHQLLLSNSADEILKQKVFFLTYARHLINDVVSNDLRFGKDIGVIPVYFDALPVSEGVRVLHSIPLGLPVLSHDDVEALRKQIKKVKRALVQLLSLNKETSLSLLNALATEAEELTDAIRADSSVQFRLYVLEFPSGLDTDTHVAIVLQSNPI